MVGLVFSISNFFFNKIDHANKLSSKKIPTSALVAIVFVVLYLSHFLLTSDALKIEPNTAEKHY